MQVNFNSQVSNNQTTFQALKKPRGLQTLRNLVENGDKIGEEIVENLKSNIAFQNLSKKYDVYVHITPMSRPYVDPKTHKPSILLEKALALTIFAKEINKTFWDIFKKKELMQVARFVPFGPEATIPQLAKYMNEQYIKPADGLEQDIIEFMVKQTK